MKRISTHCMQAKNSSLASLNFVTLLYFVYFEKKMFARIVEKGVK